MLLDVKKQETIKLSKKKNFLNLNKSIDTILLTDTIISGSYLKHPDNFVYVDISDDSYTAAFLARVYPEANFYHKYLEDVYAERNYAKLGDNVLDNSIHYLYIGNELSFCSDDERMQLYNFIQTKLAPGGYVVMSYEATVGWAEYRVVLDLLKEITINTLDIVNENWLDKVFYELRNLTLKKITALKNKEFLDKILSYLKALPRKHLEKVLLSSDFNTFYSHQIHKLLNVDQGNSFRYVGSLPLAKNYVKLGLDNNQKVFIGETKDLMVASQRQDLILMPFHRVDIWQKNFQDNFEKGNISDFYFGGISTFDSFSSRASVGHLKINFVDVIYNEIRQLSNADFFTLSEVIDKIGHIAKSPQEIVDHLMLLVMGNQVRYTLKRPVLNEKKINISKASSKLKFVHVENKNMFNDVKKFYTEMGVVIHSESALVIPFDQKTSMVIAAWTKVHEKLVPQYCAEIWKELAQESVEISNIQKEFHSILLFFKRHYFGKFLELGLLDQVLVD